MRAAGAEAPFRAFSSGAARRGGQNAGPAPEDGTMPAPARLFLAMPYRGS